VVLQGEGEPAEVVQRDTGLRWEQPVPPCPPSGTASAQDFPLEYHLYRLYHPAKDGVSNREAASTQKAGTGQFAFRQAPQPKVSLWRYRAPAEALLEHAGESVLELLGALRGE
jgi:hypothetical protein